MAVPAASCSSELERSPFTPLQFNSPSVSGTSSLTATPFNNQFQDSPLRQVPSPFCTATQAALQHSLVFEAARR